MTTDAERLAAGNAGQPRHVPPIAPPALEEPPDDGPYCSICGCELEWETCYVLGCDEGWIDLYEDDPLWYDEGDVEMCLECEGKGGYLVCPNAEHHQRDEQ